MESTDHQAICGGGDHWVGDSSPRAAPSNPRASLNNTHDAKGECNDVGREFPIKVIACIGAGYVGGPTCAVIAYKCPDIQVYVVDRDVERIRAWNSDQLPCYEEGLDKIVQACRGKNLIFTVDFKTVIEEADLIFISVNTPTKISGFGQGRAPDMQYIDSCTRLIAKYATNPKLVVEKSTVPVHAAKLISTILDHASSIDGRHVVLSNPEFLAEGTAVHNLLYPDRILIGGPETASGARAIRALSAVYSCWVDDERIVTMNTWSAEMAKLVANAVLAQRISSINSISAICEITDANVRKVAEAVGLDQRIGHQFLTPSLGFGGSCLEKDVLCLVYLAESLNMNEVADYWMQVVKVNDWQKRRFAKMIVSAMFNSLNDKLVCILGFAFKKNTADLRSSAAIDVSQYLLVEGAKLSIYDPKVPKNVILRTLQMTMGQDVSGSVACHDSAYAAASFAHAIVICTEWDEFKSLDYRMIYSSMVKPAFVFDGRLLVNKIELEKIGFFVFGIGR